MIDFDVAYYPRVLIIYNNGIFQSDQYGLLIRNLFDEWPRTHLAQVFSGGESNDMPFCGQVFKLGISERRFGRLFFSIKYSSLGDSTHPVRMSEMNVDFSLQRVSQLTRWRSAFSNLLLSTGIWELIFSPQLSSQLLKWMRSLLLM